ncbi:MAG TPA: sugar ABC transporter ATP-binding protein [Marisediminicola sp.]|nr:sugar ABC transporter ATP-binding protein [Marisediminicola sp.]
MSENEVFPLRASAAGEGAAVVDGRPRADTDPDVLLRCEGITKSFNGVPALSGVDFELRRGEVHALLGQNGAGKSTFVKIIAGVLERDEGFISINGKEHEFRGGARDALEAGIAVVYQELSLVPSFSVAANLYLGREPRNRLGAVRRRQLMRDAQAVIQEHGLNLDPRALVERLPVAYRQTAEIAKALTQHAAVLILDEPTASLSAGEEAHLFETIRKLTSRGVGVVYITHRLAEVFRIADRATVIRNGRAAGVFDVGSTDMETIVGAIVGPGRQSFKQAELDVLSGQSSEPAPSAAVAAPSTPLLELRDVSNERLRNVDLAVAPGEIVGLAGTIGSGRSEILETIFGLRKVTSGEMRLNGKPVVLKHPWDAIAHGIALAPEDRHEQGLVLDHSIERNTGLARLPQLTRFSLFRRRASKARARDAIQSLQVKAPGISSSVKTLSGGNQQKVVFGKWRNPSPTILLLDEPTVGVDVGARNEIYGIIRGLAEKGSSVIVVSSELAELLLICDRLAIVADGRLVDFMSRSAVESEEHLHRIVHEAQGGTNDA